MRLLKFVTSFSAPGPRSGRSSFKTFNLIIIHQVRLKITYPLLMYIQIKISIGYNQHSDLTCCKCFLGPMQFLKILLNELIIHEIEMIINEKTSYQLINKTSASSNNEQESTTLSHFVELLGEDFLTRISRDNIHQQTSSRENLNVKQEIFESGQQVICMHCACNHTVC